MKKIGFANQYYTLWEVTTIPQYTQYENFTVYTHDKEVNTYIKNISIDVEKVKKLYPDFDSMFDEYLRGKSHTFEVYKSKEEDWEKCGYKEINIFNHGKYSQKTIEEVFEINPKYLVWYRDEFDAYGNKYRDIIKKNISLFEPLQKWEENESFKNKEALERCFSSSSAGEQEVSILIDANPIEYQKARLDFEGPEYFGRMTSTITSDDSEIDYRNKEQFYHVKVFNLKESQMKYRTYYDGGNLYSLNLDGKGKLTKGRMLKMRVRKIGEEIQQRKLVEFFEVIEVLSIKKK